MWLAALASFFALASAVIIHVAKKEIRELVKKREKITYDKDRTIDAWTRDCFKLQDKVNSIQRENIKLAKTIKGQCAMYNRASQWPMLFVSNQHTYNDLHTIQSQNIIFTMRSIHEHFNMSNLQTVGKVFYQIYDSAAQEPVKKDLPTEEIVKRKGIVRRFIYNLKTSVNKKQI